MVQIERAFREPAIRRLVDCQSQTSVGELRAESAINNFSSSRPSIPSAPMDVETMGRR